MSSNLDIEKAADRLTDFIRSFAQEFGFTQVVLGISGGVDSAVSASLGARALGPENVLGMIMPYKSSSPQSEKDARELIDKLGLVVEKVDLTPMVDAYFDDKEVSAIRRGNKLARERMSILFDIASRDNRLVMGTSNKTEICLGYSTWYGDSACSFNPLGGMYKRDIRAMADYLEVPEKIIKKKPTADLWPGQTDEDEMGISYDLADTVLFEIVEYGERSMAALQNTGADEATITEIVRRLNVYLYKRTLPVTDLLGRQPIPDFVALDQ